MKQQLVTFVESFTVELQCELYSFHEEAILLTGYLYPPESHSTSDVLYGFQSLCAIFAEPDPLSAFPQFPCQTQTS